VQNKTHGSEVDNTEDSYLLSVYFTVPLCMLHASVFVCLAQHPIIMYNLPRRGKRGSFQKT